MSRCQKGRKGRRPWVRLYGKKPTQEFVLFGEKVLARPISSQTLNRMNSRYKFGVWLGVRSNSAECFVETAEGIFRVREIRWDKEAINSVIGVLMASGSWTGQPPPPVPFEGAREQRE